MPVMLEIRLIPTRGEDTKMCLILSYGSKPSPSLFRYSLMHLKIFVESAEPALGMVPGLGPTVEGRQRILLPSCQPLCLGQKEGKYL